MSKPVVAVLWGHHTQLSKDLTRQLNELIPDYDFKRNTDALDDVPQGFSPAADSVIAECFSILVLYDASLENSDNKSVHRELDSINQWGQIEFRCIAQKGWDYPSKANKRINTRFGGKAFITFDDVSKLQANSEELERLKAYLQADLTKKLNRQPHQNGLSVEEQIIKLTEEISSGNISQAYAKLGLLQAVALPGEVNLNELRLLADNDDVSKNILQRDIRHLKTLHSVHGTLGPKILQVCATAKNLSTSPENKQESVATYNRLRSEFGWSPDFPNEEYGLSEIWTTAVEPDYTKMVDIVKSMISFKGNDQTSPRDLVNFIFWSLGDEPSSITSRLLDNSHGISQGCWKAIVSSNRDNAAMFVSDAELVDKLNIADAEYVNEVFRNGFLLYAGLINLMHFISLLVLDFDKSDVSDFQLVSELTSRSKLVAPRSIAQIVNASNNLIWLYVDCAKLAEK